MKQHSTKLFLILLVVGTLTCSTLAAAGYPKAARIPFKLHGHLIVVEGSIGRLQRLALIIDTGASFTFISPGIARSLRLETTSGKAMSWGSQVGVKKAMLPAITVGTFSFESVPVRIRSLPTTERLRIDVLIGIDLLRRIPVRIDYSALELLLGQLPPLKSSSPFYPGLPMIPVNMRIQHIPVILILDTGAEGIVLFGKRNQLPFDLIRVNSKVRIQHSGGRAILEKYFLRGASLGESHWENLTVFLLDIPVDAYPQVDGVLGPLALGIQRIQLDFDKGTMSWE